MRKLIVLVLFSLAIGALVWGVKIARGCASNGRWGSWIDTSSCVASQCGTSEGTKNQKRTCEYHDGSNGCQPSRWIDPVYQYANAICPVNYHFQNDGDWNQRCHRNNNSIHPEHTAPTGCPTGFSKVDNNCRKTVTEGYWTTPDEGTRVSTCNTAPVIACETPSPSPTASPTASPTESPTPTPTASGEPTPTPTATPVESPAPTSTPVEITDVCANIDGVQSGVPDGKHLDASGENCVEYQFGGAPVGGTGGQEGQVLGVSTMANTGVAGEAIFNLIFVLGSGLTALGLRKLSTAI